MQGNGRARVLFVQRLKPDQNIDPAPARLWVRLVLTRCDGLRTVKNSLDMSAL
jgi:hypothetical protein